MKRNPIRRRLSLVLPALVFLSFSALETVEVAAVAETFVSLGAADAQPDTALVPGRPCEKISS